MKCISNQRLSKKFQQWVFSFSFLMPALIILLMFMALPILDAFLLSFKSWDGMNSANWVGLKNYMYIMQDNLFWLALRNTALFTIATTFFQITIPLLIANILNSKIRGSTAFRTFFFIPYVVSSTISGMLWGLILEPNFGLFNETLRLLGLGRFAQLWLADKNLVIPSIVVVSLWKSLGFYVLIFFVGLQNIPQEIVEAASLEGANSFKRFRLITVPMLRTVIMLVAVLSAISGIQVFDQVWVLTAGGPNHASEMLGTYLYKIAFGPGASFQLGYATSISIVILLLSLVISIVMIYIGRRVEFEY